MNFDVQALWHERITEKFIMRIIRIKEVMAITGLGRSTLYKLLAADKFPKSVSLGERSRGWVASEIEEWIMARIDERDLKAAS